jgi:simple sugar transport system permease protein
VTVGLLFSVGAGLSVAAVHANLSHRLTANTFVVGLTLNILVLGLATFLNRNLEPLSRQANTFEVPVLVDIPLLGPALFGQSWPLYLIYPLIPLAWWVLYRTRWGLEVRSVGENPQAADVSGIDVNKRRRQGVYVSGITSGLGGGYLLLGQIGRFEEGMVGGQGFIAIAALIFGGWTLRGAVAGCLVFGAVNSFRLSIPTNGYEVNTELLLALPFIVTIVTVSVFAHRTRQPAALARPFIRGLT